MIKMPIKIIFAGTPDLAAAFFQNFLTDKNFKVAGVLTQPDKPVGRKKELLPSPVKQIAKKQNLTIWQPENLENQEKLILAIKEKKPDFLVVIAYGQMIPSNILKIAKYGNFNVHPSLLPKYRGASPMPAAILNGEKKTGITIMLMDEKMDHGPIIAQKKITLNGDETSESLQKIMVQIGIPLLKQSLVDYQADKISPRTQNDQAATFCRLIKKEDGRINWRQPAEIIERQIRAYYPWPIAWTIIEDKRLKIFPPVRIQKTNVKRKPGELFLLDGNLMIQTSTDALIVNQLQPAGKKPMTAKEFLIGHVKIIGQIAE